MLPFEAALLDHLRRSSTVLATIRDTGRLTEETEAQLRADVEAFRTSYLAGDRMLGAQVVVDQDEPEAEHTSEQIVLKRG